jgi:hypothetical protein
MCMWGIKLATHGSLYISLHLWWVTFFHEVVNHGDVAMSIWVKL